MDYLSIYVIFDFFQQCLITFLHSSFVSLGRFIPRYFILFVAMMNEIDALISLSDFLLLASRNESDFYVLILYPVTAKFMD